MSHGTIKLILATHYLVYLTVLQQQAPGFLDKFLGLGFP